MFLKTLFNKKIKDTEEEKYKRSKFTSKVEQNPQKPHSNLKYMHLSNRKERENQIPKYFIFKKNSKKLEVSKEKQAICSNKMNKIQIDSFPSITIVNSYENIIPNKTDQKKKEDDLIYTNKTIGEHIKKSQKLSVQRYKSKVLISKLKVGLNDSEYQGKIVKCESDFFSQKIKLKENNFIENIQSNKKIPLLYNSINLVPKRSSLFFGKDDTSDSVYMNTVLNERGNNIKRGIRSKKISINILNLLKGN